MVELPYNNPSSVICKIVNVDFRRVRTRVDDEIKSEKHTVFFVLC